MIQPIDIKTQKFKKGLFGYKSSDVDSFVDSVYRAYEEVYNERNKFADDLEKLNASLQENRLKMFELENKVAKLEGSGEEEELKRRADGIISDAEAKAAKIVADAKAQAAKIAGDADEGEKVQTIKMTPKSAPKAETKEEPKAEPVKESASSRFFKMAEEEVKPAASSVDDDDDEIFVGEIEDARKPDRMMIGNGEEEEEADFEFL